MVLEAGDWVLIAKDYGVASIANRCKSSPFDLVPKSLDSDKSFDIAGAAAHDTALCGVARAEQLLNPFIRVQVCTEMLHLFTLRGLG